MKKNEKRNEDKKPQIQMLTALINERLFIRRVVMSNGNGKRWGDVVKENVLGILVLAVFSVFSYWDRRRASNDVELLRYALYDTIEQLDKLHAELHAIQEGANSKSPDLIQSNLRKIQERIRPQSNVQEPGKVQPEPLQRR